MTDLTVQSNVQPAPLNAGQLAASTGFFEFLFRDDQREMIISGPGGVGKTHLMASIADDIMPRYFSTCNMMGIPPEYTEVNMTATTNKAADVLATAVKRPTTTVQSFLNLKVKDDYKTGQSFLEPTSNWFVHEKKILFIDECSMIDSPLRGYIQKGTHKTKIVYVGDHCQLSPIKEKISPIYADDLPFFELTEPMRTSNPHLQALNNQLRQTVETGEFKPIQMVPGTIDYLDENLLQEGLEYMFMEQNSQFRVLAYTNDRVIRYNDHIRTMRNLPDEYTVGEILVNNSAVRLKNAMIPVEAQLEITALADQTEKHLAHEPEDLFIEIRRATLETASGQIFEGVPLPVDKNYFLDLIKYLARKKNWRDMYNLKNNYPDLRQRDAATTHKAQGSSYDAVIIDLADISTCHNADTVARMLYVAFSRARHRVFVFGQLAPKYGGIII